MRGGEWGLVKIFVEWGVFSWVGVKDLVCGISNLPLLSIDDCILF